MGDTGYSVAVRCRSLAYLARIIERTGQATFELRLGLVHELPSEDEIQRFIALVGENWLSRCHKLTINRSHRWVYDDKIVALQRIFLCGTFDSLEDFTWIYPHNSPTRLTLNVLLRRVDVSAPRLRVLTLYSVPEFPSLDILGGIQIFRIIYGVITSGMWSKLINVEHLDLYPWSTSGLLTFSDFPAPQLTSLCLQNCILPHSLPSENVLQKLTHLVLRSFDMGEVGNAPPLYLPSLKYLGIQFGLDTFYDGTINADKLEELAIVDMAAFSRPKVYLGERVKPRSLHLYLRFDSHIEVHSQSPSVWARLEELHLTVSGGIWDIPPTVFRALCLEDKFAPRLRHLTIRHSIHGRGDPSQAQKHIMVRELRAIMERRVEAGMAQLERLDLGWIRGHTGIYILHQDSDAWWVTEWTDCLRGDWGEGGDMLLVQKQASTFIWLWGCVRRGREFQTNHLWLVLSHFGPYLPH